MRIGNNCQLRRGQAFPRTGSISSPIRKKCRTLLVHGKKKREGAGS